MSSQMYHTISSYLDEKVKGLSSSERITLGTKLVLSIHKFHVLQLIETAVAQWQKKDGSPVTEADIARALDVTPSTITRHYKRGGSQ